MDVSVSVRQVEVEVEVEGKTQFTYVPSSNPDPYASALFQRSEFHHFPQNTKHHKETAAPKNVVFAHQ